MLHRTSSLKLPTESVDSVFASRYTASSVPKYRLASEGIPKDAAYQMIHDELLLDCNPRLNLASFVTTWMEPECDKLILESLNKNYIDIEEYPITNELQERCVNIIANLFHAPLAEAEGAVGVGCVGSSEAIMLAGLAFKRKWQQRRKAEGKPYDKPNFVCGSEVQVCWEKFSNYFEVEIKLVDVGKNGSFVMDPQEAVDMVDENTICVCGILGSTYNGEFEDIKRLNDLLEEKNAKTGWDTPIHVDAASGGFVAPFLYPELEWDFRLPLVKSINVSGHKFGLVYAGVGWVLWRSKDDLPEELIFHVNYLGADQPTFTLNFSKGASQLIAQYYQLIRLGYEGYRKIIGNCDKNAKYLRECIVEMDLFEIYSKDVGVPLVTFGLKDRSRFDEYAIAENLRQYGWIVPAYTMAPKLENVTMLRVLVREDFSRSLADRFINDLRHTVEKLKHLSTIVHPGLTHGLESSDSLSNSSSCNELTTDSDSAPPSEGETEGEGQGDRAALSNLGGGAAAVAGQGAAVKVRSRRHATHHHHHHHHHHYHRRPRKSSATLPTGQMTYHALDEDALRDRRFHIMKKFGISKTNGVC